MNDNVIDGVSNEKHGGEVHNTGVDLVSFALGFKSWNESKSKDESVETVHEPEVDVGVLSQGGSFSGVQVSEQVTESQEVDVVSDEAHEEESEDVLGSQIENEESNKL